MASKPLFLTLAFEIQEKTVVVSVYLRRFESSMLPKDLIFETSLSDQYDICNLSLSKLCSIEESCIKQYYVFKSMNECLR